MIFHGSLWHGGGANTTTDVWRCGVNVQYCPGFVRQQQNPYLGIPPEVAATFPDRLLELLGYRLYKGIMGHVDGASPGEVVFGAAHGRDRVPRQRKPRHAPDDRRSRRFGAKARSPGGAMVVLRERTDDDLDDCARLVAEVRRVDGYPPRLADNDFVRLLTEPPSLVAFVATVDDDVVGHVALHRSTESETVALACDALGVQPAQLAVVARLFSAVEHRREGVGRALLDAATDAARFRGLIPILDVWVELRAAVTLYESSGWVRIGTVRSALPSESDDVDVFVASLRYRPDRLENSRGA